LRAGSSVAFEGAASTSLLLSLAVAAAGEDSWCAIAGMPDLGLRSALDAGLDPCRLVLAPAGGDQRPQVLSALADGAGGLVPGRADLTLRATTQGWTGLGQGSGRLRRRLLEITAEGRGIAGHRTVRVLLPQIDGRIAEHPRTREEREPVRLLRPVRRAG